MSATPLKVAMVMPPVTDAAPDDAVAHWTTVTATTAALVADGRVRPVVHGRHRTVSASVDRDGVLYRFHPTDSALVAAIADEQPHAVHVHGLGWSRLVHRLHRGVDGAALVLQHHGELPFTGRAKVGHRLVRRHVAAYLFTGASSGQAVPWIDAGVLHPEARCCDVLEAASLLPVAPVAPMVLEGAPVVLWVGRLVEGKDPLTAIDAFAHAAPMLPDAHLHLLASDRTLEHQVEARLRALGAVRTRIHVHSPVPHHEMPAWYAAAHVFFSTSRHEGSGYSLIEALTCGCVPAVTSIPPHLAIAGDLGSSFPPGDAHRAAVSLATCSRMGREPIRLAARTLLTWGKVAEQLVDAYSLVVGGRETALRRGNR